METNSLKTTEEKMEFEDATMLAGVAFFERHPRSELPVWFNDSVSVSGSRNHLKQWIVRYSLVPFSPLKENQKWEEIRGNKVVVEFDPTTGKKSVLISREGEEPIIVFEVLVDPVTRTASVLVDSELADFDGDKFENYGKSPSR